jgi:phage protein D
VSVDESRPFFSVKALPEGKAALALDISDKVLSFEFVDEESKADKLSLKLDNYDLAIFDDPTFRKGTILEVVWGYPGRLAPARRAIIQRIKGARQLTIEAHGMAMIMHKVKRSRVFENRTLGEIATQIAGEYGAELAIAGGTSPGNIDVDAVLDKRTGHRVQAAETDATFLSRLARRYGLQFYVDSTGVHFKPRNMAQSPVKAFTWFNGERGDWLDFDIDNNIAARPGSVTKKGIDPLSKKAITHRADNDSTKRAGLAPVIEIIDPRTGAGKLQARNAEEHTEHSTEHTAQGLKAHAEGKFRDTQHETIKLTFKIIGDPDVLAKRVVEFNGVGKRISGRYYVKQATHTIDSSGYTVSGKAKTDGHGGYGNNNVSSKAALNKKEATQVQIEKIDPRTGQSHIEFRKSGEEGKH